MNSGTAAMRAAACLLVLGLGHASADADAPHDVVGRLRRTGELACEPSLPFFCANVHVSCAGRTSIPTFAFRLRAAGSDGSIVGPVAAGTDAPGAGYDRAHVEWGTDDADVILLPRTGRGYLRLLADGRYSWRHYEQHAGVMSIGHCR